MHLCTQSMRDFVYVTLVFDDGKWVEAHKMILAACNCLCLEKLAPTSTDLYERNSEEYFKAFDLRGNDLMLGFSSIQNRQGKLNISFSDASFKIIKILICLEKF